MECLLQYLELDVVYRWGGDHTVEGGEAMLIANLLAVQLKLRLTHLPVHIQSHHSLMREAEAERGWIMLQCVCQIGEKRVHLKRCPTLYMPAHMFWYA